MKDLLEYESRRRFSVSKCSRKWNYNNSFLRKMFFQDVSEINHSRASSVCLFNKRDKSYLYNSIWSQPWKESKCRVMMIPCNLELYISLPLADPSLPLPCLLPSPRQYLGVTALVFPPHWMLITPTFTLVLQFSCPWCCLLPITSSLNCFPYLVCLSNSCLTLLILV